MSNIIFLSTSGICSRLVRVAGKWVGHSHTITNSSWITRRGSYLHRIDLVVWTTASDEELCFFYFHLTTTSWILQNSIFEYARAQRRGEALGARTLEKVLKTCLIHVKIKLPCFCVCMCVCVFRSVWNTWLVWTKGILWSMECYHALQPSLVSLTCCLAF